MDRFELNWPGADASFYTDGWRCRIVWRQKGRRGGGGMGGTIDNNQQCVKRAAESLEGAPYLLSALKARGHARLADQIETAASVAPEVPAQPVRAPTLTEPGERRREVENRPAPKRVQPKQNATEKPEPLPVAKKSAKTPAGKTTVAEKIWLDSLEGDSAHEAATNKRAKAWFDLGVLADEALLLKTPAAKGKAEWVLKRTWPEDAKRKPEYLVAGSFRGIASFLIGAGVKARGIEQVLGALADAAHPELEAAAKAWRTGQTH